MEEWFHVLTDQIDYTNPKGDKAKRTYSSSITKTPAARVESYQRKLNLTRPQRSCPGMSAKELYTLNDDPQGVIYEDKKKRKRLMRVDKLHKFSDGTFQSVYKTLLHRLKNFRLGYNPNSDMPRKEWTKKD
nr:hypothetical protein [Tanacetum cinerariifolium]